MELQETVEINATPENVWQVMSDVERWPEWTASISGIDLETEDLELEARARIRQPRLPETEWRVTQINPGEGFVWESKRPGLRTVAGHEIEATPAGSRARIWIRFSGPLAGLVAPLSAGLTKRYLGMEAQGLKQRSEAIASRQAARGQAGARIS